MSGTLLAFDPGSDTGWGLFSGLDKKARLVACGVRNAGLQSGSGDGGMPEPTSSIVQVHSERPKRYPNAKVPDYDLITLSIRAGEVAGPYKRAGAQVTYYEPWAWKGVVPKDIHHSRLWDVLTLEEQELVKKAAKGIAPAKRHNLMDGIGIGLFALRRTKVGAG